MEGVEGEEVEVFVKMGSVFVKVTCEITPSYLVVDMSVLCISMISSAWFSIVSY
jgi:hypothetical protein